MVALPDCRDWRLVAPWWHWPEQKAALGVSGRGSHPALQKYATSKLIDQLLDDPQHYLAFDDDDWVYEVPSPAMRRLRKGAASLVRTDTRKLFLDTHNRFYLVLCELHCDSPGFPSVRRDRVCEAGFVVRRRTAPAVDKGQEAAAKGALAEVRRARRALDSMEKSQGRTAEQARRMTDAMLGNTGAAGDVVASSSGMSAAVGVAQIEQVLRDPGIEALLRADDRLREASSNLLDWAGELGLLPRLEGWVGTPGVERVGQWKAVEEEPCALSEAVYPLYPLIPDPKRTKHAGTHRTIWFGLIPTGSADTDAHGKARYDDQEKYEVRCFVREHDPRCPRTGNRGDCKGPLVWSAPSEQYRLASHFDLTGTNNLPITIQMPDLNVLRLQATKVNERAAVKIVTPAGSALNPKVSGNVPTGGSLGGPQICSVSIPLITIVATFVLNLFMPIVVFLFQLWWMLLLKFCIPPSLSLSADLNAALALKAGGADIDADVTISPTPAQIRDALKSAFGDATGNADVGAGIVGSMSNSDLVGMAADEAKDRDQSPPAATLVSGLVWASPTYEESQVQA